MKAVASHKAWYQISEPNQHDIYAARVIVTDKATKTSTYSSTEVMTFHVVRAWDGQPAAKTGDAAWKAFVRQYEDHSVIKSEYTVCVPKIK